MSPALAAVGMSRFDPRPEEGGGPGFKTLEGRRLPLVAVWIRRRCVRSDAGFRRWTGLLHSAGKPEIEPST
jgi:hypothetical protein